MIHIASSSPLFCLSSAVVGGGLKKVTRIINRHVSKQYDSQDPTKEIAEWLAARMIPLDQTVVLLTAACLLQGSKQVIERPTFKLTAWITAGIGNATKAGQEGPTYTEPSFYNPGTINILLLIEGEVLPAALVGGVITATEAKAAALADLGVTEPSGQVATGTSTDAIAIFTTQRRRGNVTHPYAGTLSPLGQAIGRAVYDGVVEAAKNERMGKRWSG